jgi:hypothetical protein
MHYHSDSSESIQQEFEDEYYEGSNNTGASFPNSAPTNGLPVPIVAQVAKPAPILEIKEIHDVPQVTVEGRTKLTLKAANRYNLSQSTFNDIRSEVTEDRKKDDEVDSVGNDLNSMIN